MLRFRIGFAILAAAALALGAGSLGADDLLPPCVVVLHEERIEREDAERELEVARSAVAAYEQIFALIQGLWEADAIDRMSYLRGKHDYAAAKLALEQAALVVERQKALEEQVRLICEAAAAGKSAADRARALESAGRAYRQADCDSRAKAIEVARVNLEFNRQFLASVHELREGQVATRQDVILAELDVEQEEKRLADATRRSEACRRELGQAEGGAREPSPSPGR